MNRKTYKHLKLFISIFLALIFVLAVSQDNLTLAVVSIVIGMLFMGLARSSNDVISDEREISIQEKSARLAYAIFAPTIGLGAILLLLPAKGGFSVFAKGDWLFAEAVGVILAYLSVLLIAIYTASHYYFNHRYGGDKHGKE